MIGIAALGLDDERCAGCIAPSAKHPCLKHGCTERCDVHLAWPDGWHITKLRKSTTGVMYPWIVEGINSHKSPPERFVWHVPSLHNDVYMITDDADDETRALFEQAMEVKS